MLRSNIDGFCERLTSKGRAGLRMPPTRLWERTHLSSLVCFSTCGQFFFGVYQMCLEGQDRFSNEGACATVLDRTPHIRSRETEKHLSKMQILPNPLLGINTCFSLDTPRMRKRFTPHTGSPKAKSTLECCDAESLRAACQVPFRSR